jgi:ribosomal protein S5
MSIPRKSNKSNDNVEWSERVVSIQRVTKVVKGGKKNEFSSSCCYRK